MRRIFLCITLLLIVEKSFCWGFFGHQRINFVAVFLLPPEMLVFYKKHSQFLSEHAVDPDKRRYAIKAEAPRHYIDMDKYGVYPYDSLPREWKQAVEKFGEDSLQAHGIVPWWIQTMLYRLTKAFSDKDQWKILKLSAEIGHYISDAHVPLHASSNHNGQFTGQKGIHGFWESRIPELLADKEWDFYVGKASYINNPLTFTWDRVLESAAAADSVLTIEKQLSNRFPADQRFAFEERNAVLIKQYSSSYSMAYNKLLNNMVERRMRQSIYAVASFWYTAWVNAGQPDLSTLSNPSMSLTDSLELADLNRKWKELSDGDH